MICCQFKIILRSFLVLTERYRIRLTSSLAMLINRFAEFTLPLDRKWPDSMPVTDSSSEFSALQNLYEKWTKNDFHCMHGSL